MRNINNALMTYDVIHKIELLWETAIVLDLCLSLLHTFIRINPFSNYQEKESYIVQYNTNAISENI